MYSLHFNEIVVKRPHENQSYHLIEFPKIRSLGMN